MFHHGTIAFNLRQRKLNDGEWETELVNGKSRRTFKWYYNKPQTAMLPEATDILISYTKEVSSSPSSDLIYKNKLQHKILSFFFIYYIVRYIITTIYKFLFKYTTNYFSLYYLTSVLTSSNVFCLVLPVYFLFLYALFTM